MGKHCFTGDKQQQQLWRRYLTPDGGVWCWLYQWPLWSLWSLEILAIFISSFFSVFPERAQHRGEQNKIIRNRLVPCPRYRGYREGAICGRFWHLSLLSTAILGDQLINSAGEQLISLLYLHLVETTWSIFSSRHGTVLITWCAIVCQMTLNFKLYWTEHLMLSPALLACMKRISERKK